MINRYLHPRLPPNVSESIRERENFKRAKGKWGWFLFCCATAWDKHLRPFAERTEKGWALFPIKKNASLDYVVPHRIHASLLVSKWFAFFQYKAQNRKWHYMTSLSRFSLKGVSLPPTDWMLGVETDGPVMIWCEKCVVHRQIGLLTVW